MTIKDMIKQPEGRILDVKSELPENANLAKLLWL